MNVFTSTMIDSKTRAPLIAINASYNRACEYLCYTYGEPCSVCCKSLDITVIKYPSRAFTYDEARGYLLEGDITV